MLPRGEATKVKCQIHFGPVPERMPMIFELEEDIKLLDRLELGGELAKITAGTSSHVTSLVSNNTDRNIFLRRRTELGREHMVKSVLPNEISPTKIALAERRNIIPKLPHIKVTNKMNGSHRSTRVS